jgi:hypothetical protein
MKSNFKDLRRKLESWRIENAGVADAAAQINLERMRVLAPLIALVNALHAVVFFFQRMDTEPGSPAYRWAVGLSLIHFGMGCTMAGCAYLTHRLRYASRSAWGVWLPLIMVAVALAFTILVVTVDQLVTPNITPFLMTCTIASLVIYLRPMASLWMFLAAFTAFYFALGITQTDAAQLLSNRLNGIVACVMGWSLSVLLWRNFTTIRMQHAQLEKANADLQLKQRQLERLTRLDGLTGLYNRNTFVELARQELERAQRHGTAAPTWWEDWAVKNSLCCCRALRSSQPARSPKNCVPHWRPMPRPGNRQPSRSPSASALPAPAPQTNATLTACTPRPTNACTSPNNADATASSEAVPGTFRAARSVTVHSRDCHKSSF